MRNAAEMFSFGPNPTRAKNAWASSTYLLYAVEAQNYFYCLMDHRYQYRLHQNRTIRSMIIKLKKEICYFLHKLCKVLYLTGHFAPRTIFQPAHKELIST
jgi:hypothetical protein